MAIRPYRVSDENEVIQLWWEAWHSSASYTHPRPITDWRKRWQNLVGSHHIVVIENEGKIIAFAAVHVSKCLLSQIFVAPNWQRQGLGQQLMQWALTHCPRGFSVTTATDNHQANAFYRAQGMEVTGHGINDFNGRPNIHYFFSGSDAKCSSSKR